MAVDPRFQKVMVTKMYKNTGKKRSGGKPNYAAVKDIELPQGTYTSIKPGPSYGQMYVAPPEDQFIDMREPVLMQQGPLETMSPDQLPDRGALIEAGDTALKAVGSAARNVGDVVGNAAGEVGGFFSRLFGGDEEDAKNKAKDRLRAKMQRQPQGQPLPEYLIANPNVPDPTGRQIYRGKQVPVSYEEFQNLK